MGYSSAEAKHNIFRFLWLALFTQSAVLNRNVVFICFLLMSGSPSSGQTQNLPPVAAAFQKNLDAASRGDVAQQLAVGKAYNDGSTGEGRRKYNEAFRWFQMAANGGSIEADAWLGSLYLFGHGTSKDTIQGAVLIQTAAAVSDPVGLRFLGAMYESGQGVIQDYKQAADSYSRAIARGDVKSLAALAQLYRRGLGVSADAHKAFDLFTKGAALGDSDAQVMLGEMYEHGLSFFSSKNANLSNSGALNGVKAQKSAPDYAMAFKLYSDSAAQNNRIAEFKLGQMYEHGAGTAPDYDQAFDLYKQSASHQFPPAILALGRLHEQGLGTAVNIVHAYIAYSLASEMNNPEANIRLAAIIKKMSSEQLEEAHQKLKQVRLLRDQMMGN